MIGSTSEDIVPLIIHGMAKNWCIMQDEQKKQPSYCWFFDRMLPGDENGAWHSSDLWYFFGTLDNSWRPNTEVDYELSDKITTKIIPADPNHCLTPEIGKSYDTDLLLEIDEIYTRPEEPDEPTIEIDEISGWINPLTFTAEEAGSTVQLQLKSNNNNSIKYITRS